MNPVIIDIETGARPPAEIEPLLPEVTAPSNYKDPAKIEDFIKQRRADQIRDAALDAATGAVLVVGILRPGDKPLFIHDDRESEVLRRTWRELTTKRNNEVFVTFCGHRFDLPYLARRSWASGVAVPDWLPRDGRYPRHGYLDLAECWQCGDRSETISLDRLARVLGLPGKSGDGADFAALWSTDRRTALDYLEHDLRLTLAVYERLAPSVVSEHLPAHQNA